MDKRGMPFRDGREGDWARDFQRWDGPHQDARDGRNARDGRDSYPRDAREGREAGHHEGCSPNFNDKELRYPRQTSRDMDQADFQGRKRGGNFYEDRDVRQMTEGDLRQKIEDRRRNYNPQ